jgi:ABC-type sugar transport system ATPase subunit
MASIRLERLSKRYGPVRAVHDLSLLIRDGELLVLLGPSGCGKSSTLKMVAGVEPPSAGEIFFDDGPVTALAPGARNVAMVFEDYALYPRMTAAENIAFPLRIRRLAAADIASRVRRIAAMLRIEGLLDQDVQRLSGGQQQRVAIGRALVREPRLLLLDEPLSHLDAELKAELRAELKRLQKDTGVTTIMVTHDQVEAMAMADRIAVMHQGRLHQVAPPDTLYRRPATAFVGGFVGEPPMNQVAARLEANEGPVLRLGAHALRLPGERTAALAAGPDGRVTFGIRPEAIVIDRAPMPEALDGTVLLRELRGDRETLRVRAGDVVLTVETSAGFQARPGERVSLRIDPQTGHFFDPASGESLAVLEAAA